MNTEQLAQIVIEKLRPDMKDYAEDEVYWINYDTELNELDFILTNISSKHFTERLNGVMARFVSTSAKHHCATDVAETLLSLCPEEFTGKFVFN